MSTLAFDPYAFVKELTKPACRKNRQKYWLDPKRC